MTNQPRTPAGSPDGGQFAETAGAEATTELSQPRTHAKFAGIVDDETEIRSILTNYQRDPYVMSRLASNRRLPVDVQHSLARSPLHAVRRAMAANPLVDPGVATTLSRDNMSAVRDAAALSGRLPLERYTELIEHDPSPTVQQTARSRQGIQRRLLAELHKAESSGSQVPDGVSDLVARYGNPVVRARFDRFALARSSRTDA